MAGRSSDEGTDVSSQEIINILKEEYSAEEYPNGPMYPYYIEKSDSFITMLYSLTSLIFMVIAYGTVFYFGMAIFKRLKVERAHMSVKTLNMHKQINQVLVIQVRVL